MKVKERRRGAAPVTLTVLHLVGSMDMDFAAFALVKKVPACRVIRGSSGFFSING